MKIDEEADEKKMTGDWVDRMTTLTGTKKWPIFTWNVTCTVLQVYCMRKRAEKTVCLIVFVLYLLFCILNDISYRLKSSYNLCM